jgi:hypothetical protein
MERTPKWVQEIENESLTKHAARAEPDSWIKSLSEDQNEEEEPPQRTIHIPSSLPVDEISQIKSAPPRLESQKMFPNVSPRISFASKRNSIFNGSFSAGQSSGSFSKDETYRSVPSDINRDRISALHPPSVVLPILTSFPTDSERVSTATESGLIAAFKSLSFLQGDIHSVSPVKYQEMLTQALEDAILFLLAQPKLLSFFTGHDLLFPSAGEGGNSGCGGDAPQKLFYCDVISSCVLNYLHHQQIAIKMAHLLALVLRDDMAALLCCDPTLRCRDKETIASGSEESAVSLWRITKSHPCEIIG